MNSILDSNAPFKKISKYKLRFKTKLWITPALQKSISVKNAFLNKFIMSKDPQAKEHHHIKYKTYRNMLSALMKKSKMNYYNHYFKTNWENLKNTWKGIKSISNINNTHSNIPKILVSNDTTSAEPTEIANIFNSLFTSMSSITSFFENDVSTQLSDVFNVSFSTGVFPSILKIAKVAPIHKKTI